MMNRVHRAPLPPGISQVPNDREARSATIVRIADGVAFTLPALDARDLLGTGAFVRAEAWEGA